MLALFSPTHAEPYLGTADPPVFACPARRLGVGPGGRALRQCLLAAYSTLLSPEPLHGGRTLTPWQVLLGTPGSASPAPIRPYASITADSSRRPSSVHRGSMPVPLTVARCQHCRLSLLAQHGCTVSIHRQPARRRMLAARRFRHRRRDRTARHVLSSHPALRSPRAERGVADTLSALTALKPSPSQRLLGGGHAARRRLPPAIWPIASAWPLRSTWLTAELSLHCRLCAHRRLSTAVRLLC